MTSSARHRWIATTLCLGKLAVTAGLLWASGAPRAAGSPSPEPTSAAPIPVKVLVVNAFGLEAAPWLQALQPTRAIPVVGLLPDAPAVNCRLDGVCQLTTGMGHANAAASMMAVLLSGQFDLHQTYFLIAGIAGIDPHHGTIGSVAWARYAVDAGIAHEIDPREAPPDWPDGLFGVLTDGPGEKPRFDYRTEVFQLDESLLQAALRLSSGTELEDREDVRAYRAHYRSSPATAAPSVTQCDTVSGDTWWAGHRMAERAARWARLLTDGRGHYCTTQQEDNATLNALSRGAQGGLVDFRRVAVLRSGSDFDRPYPAQRVLRSMRAQRDIAGAGVIAADNLVRAGMPLVDDIVARWQRWSTAVPADLVP